MFYALELRFVTMLLVLLAQIILTLLSLANVVIGQLMGSFVMLPGFIIATNVPMSIALLVLMVFDSRHKSPLSIQSEVVLCATAGGVELISAIAILFFKSSDAICNAQPSNGFWSLCSAHFAIASLLWTTTFLLLTYAIVLFCTTWRHRALHTLAEKPVWKQTVRKTRWSRETLSPSNHTGNRLRKRCPMDIDSLRRAVRDEESQPIPRQMGSFSVGSPLATHSHPVIRPPGLDSPVGFAERMGYFRREARGEYVPSTPTTSREALPANPHQTRSEEIGGIVFAMQTLQLRRPSYPDLPNPFPPRSMTQDVSAQPSPKFLSAVPSNPSRSSSESSTRSGKESDSGFAGVGAGSGSRKEALQISVPVPRPLAPRQSLGPPSARSTRTLTSNELLGKGNQQPFRISAPTTPTIALSLPPRQSFQPSPFATTPTSLHLRQAGARPGYNFTQQPRSHASLAATLSTTSALESAYGLNPMAPRYNRPKSQYVGNEIAQPQGAFLQVPPVTMSPSTLQRISNAAYPLPLPSLSTYPIKSVARQASQPSKVESITGKPPVMSVSSALAPALANEPLLRERPLSTVSSVSCYSTSSASHGPVPPREIFGPAVSAIPVESRLDTQQPTTAPVRRLSRPKTPPSLSRGLSQHGMNSQNRWGGTGNGPARRNLATQFQQPRVEPGRRID